MGQIHTRVMFVTSFSMQMSLSTSSIYFLSFQFLYPYKIIPTNFIWFVCVDYQCVMRMFSTKMIQIYSVKTIFISKALVTFLVLFLRNVSCFCCWTLTLANKLCFFIIYKTFNLHFIAFAVFALSWQCLSDSIYFFIMLIFPICQRRTCCQNSNACFSLNCWRTNENRSWGVCTLSDCLIGHSREINLTYSKYLIKLICQPLYKLLEMYHINCVYQTTVRVNVLLIYFLCRVRIICHRILGPGSTTANYIIKNLKFIFIYYLWL